MARDPLALDAEAMRRMGYQVVDMLVDRIARLPSEQVIRQAAREAMEALIDEPPPNEGRDFEGLLARLDQEVLAYMGHFDHPRFFGYIPGAGTWPAALGDLIAAATNIDAGAWREAAGPSQLELTVLGWFRDWIGYPSESAGILTSGGSAANLTAIACAREALIGAMSPRIVAYTSDQTHSSVARAARHLGFRPDQVRVLPTDDEFRLKPDALAAAMDADVAIGRLPFLVSCNAGTTSTGAVDPIEAIAEICRARGVWLHVDAAYGGFAVLTERGREAMSGLALADSVTLDPHKWLAMPFEVGCLMVRSGELLERAFELHPEYLQERVGGSATVNFSDRGLQLTRSSRAIKVWLAIQSFGLDAFRETIDRAMDLALEAQRLIENDPRLELITPARLGIVTFRRRGEPGASPAEIDRLNERVVAGLVEDADVLLTSTLVGGRYAIRLCILNHSSAADDVAYALRRAAAIEVAVEDGRHPASTAGGAAREAGVDVAWLRTHGFGPDELRAIPGFEAVDDDKAKRFLSAAREQRAEPGQLVTEQWAYSRTFYLVLSGRLSVQVAGAEVNSLAPGEHFGEIAAIDWGRDFSYGRTATVVAVEPTRVLAIPGAALRELMAESPELDRAMRRIAQARLATA